MNAFLMILVAAPVVGWGADALDNNQFAVNDSTITTSGFVAVGIQSPDNSLFAVNDSTITTSGESATGISSISNSPPRSRRSCGKLIRALFSGLERIAVNHFVSDDATAFCSKRDSAEMRMRQLTRRGDARTPFF